jgi:hypothetical protein
MPTERITAIAGDGAAHFSHKGRKMGGDKGQLESAGKEAEKDHGVGRVLDGQKQGFTHGFS